MSRTIESRVRQSPLRGLATIETHYAWWLEGHDTTELKQLIGLAVKWIEMELETDEPLASMPRAKPPTKIAVVSEVSARIRLTYDCERNALTGRTSHETSKEHRRCML